ncbi:glycosyltransferase [Chitinophaga polysaccharea]|uniref:glycosyltransferase family 2 protein n=1 Tax=Chitinophaga polysaccharea TaxID=1293035 RepID=UPI001455C6FB|nr:glycosyltransferase family 2 protein [Chitinophaga polysaccharea]NLR56938.1 glycosyltransferase [Chitinophaga polysaccharea]
MNFFERIAIKEYHDVSILIYVPEDASLLVSVVLQNIHFYQRNGIELVIVANRETDIPVIESLLDAYPFVNWRIVYVNCGVIFCINEVSLQMILRRVRNSYLMIVEPGWVFKTDVIYQLRYMLENHPYAYALGKVILDKSYGLVGNIRYSCLLVHKLYVDRAISTASTFNGVIELIKVLDMLRLRRINVGQAVLFEEKKYLNQEYSRRDFCCLKSNGASPSDLCGHYKIVFDYMTDRRNCFSSDFVKKFERFDCTYPENLHKKFSIICLIQVKNESKYLSELLTHLEQRCDGIILLDDGSSDNSYEMAVSDKILIKARKKPSAYFNDLENRNLLLQLGHLVLADWFFFMDADERFHDNYSDLRSIANIEDVDSVSFRLVHVWNEADKYRKNLPEGEDGIVRRYRMFRNKGYMQINSKREIHFLAMPYRRNEYHADVLLIHYGLMDSAVRKEKYIKYLKQDSNGVKQGYGYSYLLDENIELGDVRVL